jgi:hypothetical protein
MKVKCIDNDKGVEHFLTIGKTYDAIKVNEVGDDFYCIIDDNNDKLWYDKTYFKSLSEYRNERIDKLLR